MIKKIDHVAFAVKDLEASKRWFIDAFRARLIYQKENSTEHYIVAIFKLGSNVVSLIAPTSAEGFIAKHIEHFGEGIQHIGVEVDSLDETLEHWEQFGFKTGKYEEVPGVRRQVLLSHRDGFGVIWQVMDWLDAYKDATDEERMGRIWG